MTTMPCDWWARMPFLPWLGQPRRRLGEADRCGDRAQPLGAATRGGTTGPGCTKPSSTWAGWLAGATKYRISGASDVVARSSRAGTTCGAPGPVGSLTRWLGTDFTGTTPEVGAQRNKAGMKITLHRLAAELDDFTKP